MTMGVGEEIWEQFGHNALWLHDNTQDADVVYNWGLFDFNQPHFIPRFLKGQMLYSMGGFELAGTLAEYRARDRSVWVQELDLTPAERQQLREFVEWNAQPEHRDYYYDYYRDNCSTRVRDALDRVLGGQIRAAATRIQTGHSYRWHTLRLTQSNAPLATGMDIGLGEPGDHELTAWEAMFLPTQLRDFAQTFQVRRADGSVRPLVRSDRLVFRAMTHAEPTDAPHWLPWDILLGLTVAGAILVLGWNARRSRRARLGLGALATAWALVAALVGLLLFLLWTITDHRFAHHNENLAVLNPLWFVVAVTVPLAISKGRAVRLARLTTWLLAAGGVGALLAHVVGLSAQHNGRALALAVPPTLALAWILRRDWGLEMRG